MLAIAATIFLLSARPGSGDPPIFWHADKVAHAAIFGLFAGSLLRALVRSAPTLAFRFQALVSVGATALYGISDELHQLWVPGRTSDPLDVLADLLGGLLACAAWFLWRRRLAKGSAP